MTTKKVLVLSTTIACAALLGAGCASKTIYVDSDSSNLVTTVSQIDIQDFNRAADEMCQSLIEYAGAELVGENGEKPIIAISRIVNNTPGNIDTNFLVKRIRVTITRSGLASTSATLNLSKSEDPLAQDSMNYEEALDEASEPLRPSYTLSGRIIQVRAKDGKKTQNSFEFQLTLSDRKGTVLWEDLKTIIKQGKKPSVGF